MAETFSSESAAIRCSSKRIRLLKKPFRRPRPQHLNPPPYPCRCNRPRRALLNLVSRFHRRIPHPISLIRPRACRPPHRVVPRHPWPAAPFRIAAISLNLPARPRVKKGKLCSPKDSFPISGTRKNNLSRPKPFHHLRRLLCPNRHLVPRRAFPARKPICSLTKIFTAPPASSVRAPDTAFTKSSTCSTASASATSHPTSSAPPCSWPSMPPEPLPTISFRTPLGASRLSPPTRPGNRSNSKSSKPAKPPRTPRFRPKWSASPPTTPSASSTTTTRSRRKKKLSATGRCRSNARTSASPKSSNSVANNPQPPPLHWQTPPPRQLLLRRRPKPNENGRRKISFHLPQNPLPIDPTALVPGPGFHNRPIRIVILQRPNIRPTQIARRVDVQHSQKRCPPSLRRT